MDIISARLEAINPTSQPQSLLIPTRPGEDFIIGRSHFSNGQDTIISRRHAKFNINNVGPERLVVTNLSLINGILVNFTPLQPFEDETLYDGDEIVLPSLDRTDVVFFRRTRLDGAD